MVEPPLERGMAKETVAWVFPATAETDWGGEGGPSVVVEVGVEVAERVPTTL
jgi:hypothetical protein